MTEHLFVYGTLAPGRPNEHVLSPLVGTWQPAMARGTLYTKGWGAAMGYPGIVLDEACDWVSGFVFSSDDLKRHWLMLDEFEGDGYRRVMTGVRLVDGSLIDAFVYELISDQPGG